MTLRFVLVALCMIPVASAANAEEVPPPAIALDHVALHVSDLDRSATFYKQVFGLREIKSPVPIARWLLLANGTTLHLVKGRTVPQTNSRWDHFALSCEDMDKMLARLDEQKIAWSDMAGKHEPQVRADGIRQIFVQDPDGYWIEINDALKVAD